MAHVNSFAFVPFGCTKGCFMIGSVFCTYGALRMQGLLAIFLLSVGVFSQAFLITLLMTLGEVHSRANTFLHRSLRSVSGSGRVRGDIKWMRRQIRCFPALSLRVGWAYIIDKPIVLTALKITFDTTVNFLLVN